MKITYTFFGGPLHLQHSELDPSELPLAARGGIYRVTGGAILRQQAPSPAMPCSGPTVKPGAGPGTPSGRG